ncbi:MAG TPA: alkaline phosphatase family protein [Solirubrobacterales bacterium]|nr:alkaline phosphatase family protein [Solirubrobacterales bacterium]
MNSTEDEGPRKARAERCAECDAALSASQRYCFECGARRGALPAVVANRIDALKERGRSVGGGGGAPLAPAEPAGAAVTGDGPGQPGKWDFMPSPQIAAVVVMALLAAGVVLGSVTSPLAHSAGTASIILEEMGGSEAPESKPETVASSASVTPEPTAVPSTAEAPLAEPLAPEPEPEPSSGPEPVPFEPEEEELLPEIKHVFLIVLEGHGYEEAFGDQSQAPYLAKTLAGEGKLLPNYFAVTQGALANEIALLSGQGPTPQTAANCPEYTAIVPGALSAEGQVEGAGCVYPATTETLPGQLTAAKLSWKAYVEDIANGEAAGQPTTCRHPALGGPDASPAPVPGDAFQTWRSPLVYFAGLTESPECAERDVGLDGLATDLKKAKTTPSLSYIVPNACHDGSETPCAPEQPAGLAAVDGFLEAVVPEITASPAYEEEGGLIAITFDQAPQTGPAADSSSCCATPVYPNLPPPSPPASEELPGAGGVKKTGGGGRVGMLLLSPYVAPGTVEEGAYFNHFSFLLGIEELFGLESLGYAAEPALTGFEPSLFDASPEESTAAEPAASPAGSK